MIATTFGLVADLSTTQGQFVLAKALQNFANKDFHSGAASARNLKMKFFVAAGCLNLPDDGIVQALAHDEAAALECLVAVNRRMGEAGASSTRWIIAGDAGFQQRAMQVALAANKEAS